MEKWMVHSKRADFNKIADKFNIDPVIARVIRNRDVISFEEINEYLNGNIENLYSPFLLKDLDKALEIIEGKISQDKKIRIIGDYDIDGICSTYILLSGLKRAGAFVDIDIPDRITDGYGININLIKKAFDDGVDTIITCDNGIMAVDETAYAKSLGMTVVITDHHNVPEILPKADAIINPKQADCQYPFKELCGGAVAYKLIQGLFEKRGESPECCYDLIEYAAIATIGDVVTLQGENRIIAKEGLKLINKTTNKGLKALIKANDLADKRIESYHIGFIIGPCLNASGRLDTAKKAFKLLNEDDEEMAALIANELKELNSTRKELTLKGVDDAIKLSETMNLDEDKVVIIYLPECHESLAGIIAGRIREKYYRPVFVLTKSEDGVKGSGRSIEGYNMHQELTRVEGILTKYGGHSMAAGLSLEEAVIDIFKERLNKNSTLTQDELTPKLWIDSELPFEFLNMDLVKQLRLLEPFGKGNEKPIFAARNITIMSCKIVGSSANVMSLVLISERGTRFYGVSFEKDEFEKITGIQQKGKKIKVIYYPQINEYNGNIDLRINVKRVSDF